MHPRRERDLEVWRRYLQRGRIDADRQHALREHGPPPQNNPGTVGGGIANLAPALFYQGQSYYGYYSTYPPYPDFKPVATITNSTLSGNESTFGTAIMNDLADLLLTNDTITDNDTKDGAGNAGALDSIEMAGDILMINTLIAGNVDDETSTITPSDVKATIDSKSVYNLIGDGDNLTGITNGKQGNQIGSASAGTVIDPMLGPLASNGGPTETVALLPGSPAIDAGTPPWPSIPTRNSP